MSDKPKAIQLNYSDAVFEKMCGHVRYAMSQADDPEADAETLAENAVAHILRIATENVGEG